MKSPFNSPVTPGPYLYIDSRKMPGAGTRNGELVTLPPEKRFVLPADCYGYCDTAGQQQTSQVTK